MLHAHKKMKGNRFDKSKYQIPYYSVSYFNPGKEEGEEETEKAFVKIPVRIDSGEGEKKSNQMLPPTPSQLFVILTTMLMTF